MPDTSQPDSPTQSPPRLKPGAKRISLALQGGGSHGAFTWGVMHRLMSEPRLYIDGISGTSAGAMNAVVFADGFLKGRRQGAIDALEQFWNGVADLPGMPRSVMRGIPGISEGWAVDNDPAFMMLDLMTRVWSPAQFNPVKVHPLRDLLVRRVRVRLPEDELAEVRHKVPIVYVEAVPVRVDHLGRVEKVGLLLRARPDGTISRALVSGRVLYGESVRDALWRHLSKDLGREAEPSLPPGAAPFTVVEYFPDPGRSGYHDPRQHAISLCFVVPVDGECRPAQVTL